MKKVLLQEWDTCRGHMSSISKNAEQLAATIKSFEKDDTGEPSGDPMEVGICEDESVGEALAKMIENDTVFLKEDELDFIDYDV